MAQDNRAHKIVTRPKRVRDNVVHLSDAKRPVSKKTVRKKEPKKKASGINFSTLLNAFTGGAHTKTLDKTLLLIIIILVVFGLVMVFSASAPSASAYQNNPYHYIIRQGIFAVMGLAGMFFFANFDYHKLGKFAFPLLVFSAILLFAVYIPHVGIVRNNARRWINLGIATLQPSEVVKVSIILFFAYSLSHKKEKIRQFKSGLLPYVLILGFFAGVIAMEPHLSATLIIGMTAVVMLFIAGARLRHFAAMAVPVVLIGIGYIMKNPYQMQRIITFLDPFADPSDTGFQVVNSLYAIGSGGVFGLGLGQSRQKYLYLPEPQNDFIFAIVCEELGLIGAFAVLVLFGCLIWKGYRAAMEAPDMFGTLLATGITSLIGIQVLMNVAVVTSSMPATGVALPFFSYGGTSLLILLCSMGILLNVSRQAIGKTTILKS